MAFYFQKTYRPEIEQLLRQYYQSLSEKDRRRFAALEAVKLGHGGTRYIAKVLGCDPPPRREQFRHLAPLIQEFLAAGNPVLSIDTKKKEFLGTLYRNGKVYGQQALKAFDHDFPSLATGVIIPHGIYDLARNQGW